MKIFVYLFLLFVSLGSVAQNPSDDWRIEARKINPDHYYGVTVANGMVGLVSSPEPMKVKDVVTFYPMFFEEPVGKYVIRVCHTLPCALRDCKLVLDHIKEKLGIDIASETDLAKGTTDDSKFTIMKVECLASCDVAPVMMVNDDLYKNLTPEKVDEILDTLE